MLDHPKYEEICGYAVCDKTKAMLAFLVYLDLTENKGWWNVSLKPCEKLRSVIICGHSERDSILQYVFPEHVNSSVNVKLFRTILSTLKEEYGATSVLIAFVSEDSTANYTRIDDGLTLPEPPEALEHKARQQKRKMRRRHQRFVNLSSLPHNQARYSLTSTKQKTEFK